MIARYTGAALGLLAFAIVVVSGLLVQNPITVTLSRALFALYAFLIIGLVLGGAAQLVVNEHRKSASAELERRLETPKDGSSEAQGADRPPVTDAGAVGG